MVFVMIWGSMSSMSQEKLFQNVWNIRECDLNIYEKREESNIVDILQFIVYKNLCFLITQSWILSGEGLQWHALMFTNFKTVHPNEIKHIFELGLFTCFIGYAKLVPQHNTFYY